MANSPDTTEENGGVLPEKPISPVKEKMASAATPIMAADHGLAQIKSCDMVEENGNEDAYESAANDGLTEMTSHGIAEENNGVVPEKPSVLSPFSKTISESPIKEDLALAATPVIAAVTGLSQMKSRWSSSSSKRSFGSSRDEIFFDSHQWLQSDSEDDFFSVNGDFTPSRGNTPKCSFSEKHPRFHNPLFEEEKPRVSFPHSLAPRRKKLGELFRDSIREEREELLEESSENHSELSKKSSGDNSGELKVIEDCINNEKKNLKSLSYHHRCLPRFSSFKESLMEKRKKKKKIHLKCD